MGFREKMVWVMLVATLVASAIYFVSMATVLREAGFVAPASAGIGFGAVIVMVIIAIAGAIVSALSNIRDASAPEDERDREISRRSEAVTALILAFGVGGLIVAGHMADLSQVLVPALVAALIASQLVGYVVQIVLYRRGG